MIADGYKARARCDGKAEFAEEESRNRESNNQPRNQRSSRSARAMRSLYPKINRACK